MDTARGIRDLGRGPAEDDISGGNAREASSNGGMDQATNPIVEPVSEWTGRCAGSTAVLRCPAEQAACRVCNLSGRKGGRLLMHDWGIWQARSLWLCCRPCMKQRSWHLVCLGLPACSLEEEWRQKHPSRASPEQLGRPACPSGSEPGPKTCQV